MEKAHWVKILQSRSLSCLSQEVKPVQCALACPTSYQGSNGLFNLCILNEYHTVPSILLHHSPGVFYGKCGKMWYQTLRSGYLAHHFQVSQGGTGKLSQRNNSQIFSFFSKPISLPWWGRSGWVAKHLCVHWNLILFPALEVTWAPFSRMENGRRQSGDLASFHWSRLHGRTEGVGRTDLWKPLARCPQKSGC